MNSTSSTTIAPYEQLLVEFKRIVEGYLLSLVCICGLLGNALTCVILSSRMMRTSTTNIYIFALSCASSCVLIGFLLTHGIRSTFDAEIFYEYIFTKVFPIHVTCLLIQIYLTATVAFDRFILICFPFRGHKWRTPRHAVFVVLCVALFCILYCIPFWFEFTLVKRNNTRVISVSTFGAHPLFRLLMRKYLYFVFVFLIPLSTIIICKAMIIKKLYAVRKRKRLLGNLSKQNRSSNAINFLLLSIVFVFLVTQFPYFIFNVLYSWFGISLMANLRARQYLAINNLLSVINASSTFILYAFFDRKFRQVGQHFLLCRPLPIGFDAQTGIKRIPVSNRNANVQVPNTRSCNSSIDLIKSHRYSATVNNNIQDLTRL
ncbi:unnamed protein product [Rotaria magnacalcarata]|uniref:G-protein coupled receptors family 1 profile domain-containing protein n=1 Tax=Rotaria magnacalcarata TaxID=392030 RepID=A0A816CN26_9BILA|nr:unnamed protein product [Rotaria magnacalcarata]CAF1626572.1 unnamed protein product [Rotaria magnacalcarata]CAF2205966.1 unnamed protein product [Rotaria magnacalcarata]CAF4090339.1 unnamed protein product [Rotaria magnacalcarata]CAF4113012.1 unnamed protein product [Rotaria magnacalcarata]